MGFTLDAWLIKQGNPAWADVVRATAEPCIVVRTIPLEDGETVDTGKSITVITFTSFLDGIFIATMAPIVYFSVGKAELFAGIKGAHGWLGAGFFVTFWVVYGIILLYKLFVAYALFVNPVFVKRALVGIFSIKGLRRWRRGMVTTGDQLITAAAGLKVRGWNYWWPALLTSFLSWMARFSIVNCIVHAFHPGMGFNLETNDASCIGTNGDYGFKRFTAMSD